MLVVLVLVLEPEPELELELELELAAAMIAQGLDHQRLQVGGSRLPVPRWIASKLHQVAL